MIKSSPRSSEGQGLTYCNRCNECCINPCCVMPGEVGRIAKFLGVETLAPYVDITAYGDGYLVTVQALGGACRFLTSEGCSVHNVKPAAGRAFKCWDKSTWKSPAQRHEYVWGADDLVKVFGESMLIEVGM